MPSQIHKVASSRRCRSKKKVLQRNSNFLCFRPKRQIRWRCIKKNYFYWSLGYPARALSVDRRVEAWPKILVCSSSVLLAQYASKHIAGTTILYDPAFSAGLKHYSAMTTGRPGCWGMGNATASTGAAGPLMGLRACQEQRRPTPTPPEQQYLSEELRALWSPPAADAR